MIKFLIMSISYLIDRRILHFIYCIKFRLNCIYPSLMIVDLNKNNFYNNLII